MKILQFEKFEKGYNCMKKQISRFLVVFMVFTFIFSMTVFAKKKEPAIMASLRSYIQTYGVIRDTKRFGRETYDTSITYNKKKKSFLFKCVFNNGSSTSEISMVMPSTKKKFTYTVEFKEVVRASGKTAKIEGTAKLKRRSYGPSVNLRFSRRNKSKLAKKITNAAYQSAANTILKVAFSLWELSLEKEVTICFRNFGFSNSVVFDPKIYINEW